MEIIFFVWQYSIVISSTSQGPPPFSMLELKIYIIIEF